VGLSWATVSFTTENLLISDLVEVDEEGNCPNNK